MDEHRPSRWQQARKDSAGFFVPKREVVALIVGGMLSIGALALFDSPNSAMQEFIVVAAGAVGAAVLVPAAELTVNYVRAPGRILAKEFQVLGDRIRRLEQTTPQEQPRDPQVLLLDLARRGDVLINRLSAKGLPAEAEWLTDEAREAEVWANSVIQETLATGMSTVTEDFLRLSDTGVLSEDLFRQITLLRNRADDTNQ